METRENDNKEIEKEKKNTHSHQFPQSYLYPERSAVFSSLATKKIQL